MRPIYLDHYSTTPVDPLGAVRLSLGRATTADDVKAAASSLAAAWRIVSEPSIRSGDQSAPRRPVGSGQPTGASKHGAEALPGVEP